MVECNTENFIHKAVRFPGYSIKIATLENFRLYDILLCACDELRAYQFPMWLLLAILPL